MTTQHEANGLPLIGNPFSENDVGSVTVRRRNDRVSLSSDDWRTLVELIELARMGLAHVGVHCTEHDATVRYATKGAQLGAIAEAMRPAWARTS